jgi:hypothetical protein
VDARTRAAVIFLVGTTTTRDSDPSDDLLRCTGAGDLHALAEWFARDRSWLRRMVWLRLVWAIPFSGPGVKDRPEAQRRGNPGGQTTGPPGGIQSQGRVNITTDRVTRAGLLKRVERLLVNRLPQPVYRREFEQLRAVRRIRTGKERSNRAPVL